MKLNKFKYIVPALLMGVSACTDDEPLMQGVQQDGESGMEFAAEMAANPKSLSKTTLSNGWGMIAGNNPSDVLFLNSDKIGVFSTGESASTFAVKGLADNGRKAVFAGKTDKSDGYYALYPYQADAKISGNKISAAIPTSQAVVDDNMDGNAALGVAYTTAEAKTFAFHNVTTMISFISTGSYTSITVEALDGTKIAGDIQIEVSQDGALPVVTGGTESKVTLEGGNLRNGWGYCVMLRPCTIKKGQLKFTFTKDDGTSFSQTNEKDVTLEAGICYNYGYIGNTKLTVYNGKEVAFVKYIDPSYTGGVTLPEIPCEDEGYLYLYNTAEDGTGDTYSATTNNWFSFTEDATLYLQKVKGCVIKIYDPEGADVIFTKTVRKNYDYGLPFSLQSSEGVPYGFSFSKNGSVDLHRGVWITIGEEDEMVLYAVPEEMYTVAVYGNGADAEPTFSTVTVYGEGLYLPALPISDGVIYGYATSENGAPQYQSRAWVNVYGNINLYIVTIDLFETLTSRAWTWDTEMDGSVWGNAGYQAGLFDGNSIQGKWWGATNAGFEDQLMHSNTGKLTGEEDANAYMVFDQDKQLLKYDASGNLLNTGSFSLDGRANVIGSAFGYLNTSEGAILWPFMINGGGTMPTSFEIAFFSDQKLQLIYAPDGTGSWSECTWWAFKAKE